MSTSLPSSPPTPPVPSPLTVTVIIPPQLIVALKAAGKQLCIARKVTPEYNIIWGTASINETTTFIWDDDFDAFYKKFPFTFEAGKEVEPADSIDISKGQTLIIDKDGKMSVQEGAATKEGPKDKVAKATAPPSDHILVKNRNGDGGVRIGLGGAFTVNLPPANDKTPFFIQHYSTIIGEVEIFPLNKVLIWLGDTEGNNAVTAGTIFTAAYGVCELDLTTAISAVTTLVPVGKAFAWLYADSTGEPKVQAFDWKDDKLTPWVQSRLGENSSEQMDKDKGKKDEKDGKASKDEKPGSKDKGTAPPAVTPDPATKPSNKTPKDQTVDKNSASNSAVTHPVQSEGISALAGDPKEFKNGENSANGKDSAKSNESLKSTAAESPASLSNAAAQGGIVEGVEQLNMNSSH